MDKIVIQGGKPLSGQTTISGSKNATLPMMAASLLANGTTVLQNIPDLNDIKTMANLLRIIGAKVQFGEKKIFIDTQQCSFFEAPYELVKTMRGSFYVLGPLLAKYGSAKISLPGGCAWGPRPVDFHIKAMQQLGAQVSIEHGYVTSRCNRLQGAQISFDIQSVGATCQVIMAASLAEGETVILNAAKEPEVYALAQFINAMGGKISGHGTDTVRIRGVKLLQPITFSVPPDRIETGTFLIAAAITKSRFEVKGARFDEVSSLADKLRQAGVQIESQDSRILIDARERNLNPLQITTAPFPGFPTDLQAQIMALMCITPGNSIITDTIYRDRFTHVPELRRLGANIQLDENIAIINGVRKLSGAQVMATDLRASVALVLAGLVADGITEIHRIYHLDRGYEKVEEKLAGLGAQISREKDELPF